MKARKADLHDGWIASVARSCASVSQSARSQDKCYRFALIYQSGLLDTSDHEGLTVNPVRRWRAISKHKMAVAEATFRDSTDSAMGIDTQRSMAAV